MSLPIPEITVRTTCRCCGSDNLTELFSLGEQYVSNFVEKSEVLNGIKCPITLQLCNECTLVQMKHTAPQELLYTRNYWYRSGTTDTMRKSLKEVTEAAERVVPLRSGDIVLDIGSNDGTLLRSYKTPGIITVGVEPAKNLAYEGSRGIDVFINDFWSAEAWYEATHLGGTLERPKAVAVTKVITACGMMYDLEDPNQFVGDVAKVLAKDGVFIAQLMCLKQMLEIGDLGNLAHEHLEFYSLVSLSKLLDKHGLEIFDIEENKVNGGSYRLFIRHNGSGVGSAGPGIYHLSVIKYSALENGMRLHDPLSYNWFMETISYSREKCVSFIRSEVAKGKKVWVYGASTKGNVILQFFGLDTMLITGASDRSPTKHGLCMVGSGIPIFSEEVAREANPDYFLVLPFAFIQEFQVREEEWLRGGGKFIVPFPTPMLVWAGNEYITKVPL